MNDRDSPIWQNPAYWPMTLRITPNWHRESSNKVAVDSGVGVNQVEREVNSHGFDLSGLDILNGGTLYNNISFLLTPSSDNTATFHFESAWVRFDNLLKSPWLNLKFGKFELDNVVSEKRIMNLSNNGGLYHVYHFSPVGDTNFFGQIGDNQLGMEWLGHSKNDRTRISASLLSSNDGQVNLPNGNSYSGFFAASQAFDTGKMFGNADRIGAYAMVGQAPTYYLTSGGVPIPGTGLGNKGYSREGVFGLFYLKKLDFTLLFQHGSDSAYFGTGTQANLPLPVGARSPSWNGGFLETHYTVNPQLIFIQRDEFIRMSQQALPTLPSSLGNVDAYTFSMRWYPFMYSRAGFAIEPEYSMSRQQGAAPITGTSLTNSSVFLGMDFDF
ncbi:MAG TPA: hypothetical protein VKT29_16950 [Terriglobales bacterium]|nr:hypothetical protein [Terriglobales bacterium]